MAIEEYMEFEGTPKVWVVEQGSSFDHNIYTRVFLTEEEAKATYNSVPDGCYKHMYRTWDIWGFTKRHCR